MAADFVHRGEVTAPRFGLRAARRVTGSVRNGLPDQQREVTFQPEGIVLREQDVFCERARPILFVILDDWHMRRRADSRPGNAARTAWSSRVLKR